MTDLHAALVRDFPEQFAHIRGPCECGDGWMPLIRRACEALKDEAPQWDCIKEKFGGLRMGTSNRLSPDAWEVVGAIEAESFTVCEDCGEPGEHSSVRGWLRTVCKKHYDEAMKRE